MVGISKTLEVFDDLGVLAVDGIIVAKSFAHGAGIGAVMGSIGKLMEIAKAIEELVKDIPQALPELKDLDASEVSILSSKAYALVKKVIESV